ncbi:hypothetical protein [Sporosarcina sp. ITBMC105]
MFIYGLHYEKDSHAENKRNLDETKLTYADYHGNIPADDDIADYYRPLKGVRIA